MFILFVSLYKFVFRITPRQKRQLEGCLCRVPSSFYNHVWDIMMRTPQGIKVSGNVIPQQPTLSNMTRSELTFSLLVEEVKDKLPNFVGNTFFIRFQMLNHIQQPEYRQLIVELLHIVFTILGRNPELTFNQPLDLGQLIKDAAHMYAKVK